MQSNVLMKALWKHGYILVIQLGARTATEAKVTVIGKVVPVLN
jgi:hypothetical protein